MSRDTAAIQRHRNTIVECLKDLDVSIRRRALDLIYALVTKSNVKTLAKELLTYLALTSGDSDFKADLTDKIVLVVEKYAPSRQWHIETISAVLVTAGTLTKENVSTDLILLISRSTALHPYAAYKLFFAIRKGSPHLPLIHVALWCIGEYGDYLISKEGADKAREADDKVVEEPVTERMILDTLRAVQSSKESSLLTKEYLLNALIKLSSRLSVEANEELKRMMADYEASVSVELQQRSCEYRVLTSDKLSKIRNGVVARMPVPTKQTRKQRETEAKEKEEKEKEKKLHRHHHRGSKKKKQSKAAESEEEEDEEDDEDDEDEDEDDDEEDDTDEGESEEDEETTKKKTEVPKSNGKPVKKVAPAAAAKAEPKPLLDLDSIFGPGAPVSTSPQPMVQTSQSFDLLGDIFGGGGGAGPQQPAATASMPSMDPFAALSGAPAPAVAPAPPASVASPSAAPFFGGSTAAAPTSAPSMQSYPPAVVFDKDGLAVTFQYQRNPATPALLSVTALFSNRTAADFTAYDFQVAVAKNAVTLVMQPASASVIPAKSEQKVRQELTLNNALHGQKKLVIKVRITYQTEGRSVVEQATISQFPD